MHRTYLAAVAASLLISVSGAAEPRTPDFPRGGLLLWLKADGEKTLEGQTVIQWNDMSGRQNHAKRVLGSGANPANPVFVPDGFGGKPVIRFDGTESWFSFRRIADIRTVFWVVRKDPKSFGQHNQRFILGDSARGPRYDADFHAGAHKTGFIWHEALSSPFVREGETRLNGKLVNGVTTDFPRSLGVISLVTTGSVWANQLCRDREYTDGRSWQGDIAEILVYNVPLADGDRERVERYLIVKYGITGPGKTQGEKEPGRRRIAPARTPAPPEPVDAPPPAYVSSIAFSPDGRTIASGSFDGSVRLLDARDGSPIRTLEAGAGRIWHVAFSPDGALIGAGAADRTIRIWDAKTGSLVRTIPVETDFSKRWWMSVWCFGFSPNGRSLVSIDTDDQLNRVLLIDPVTGNFTGTLEGHRKGWSGRPWWVAYSPDGRLVASSGEDRTIRLWDSATRAPVRVLNTHSIALSFAFSPDGKSIAAAGTNMRLELWDAAQGVLKKEAEGHTAALMAVAYSPDGKVVASGSDDTTVKLWNAETGKLIRTLSGHSSGVWAVAFSPDGRAVASGGQDNTIRLFDRRSGVMLRTILPRR